MDNPETERGEDDDKFVAAARKKYITGNGNVNVDDGAEVSQGEGGAYVAAWVWVSDKEAGIEDQHQNDMESMEREVEEDRKKGLDLGKAPKFPKGK